MAFKGEMKQLETILIYSNFRGKEKIVTNR